MSKKFEKMKRNLDKLTYFQSCYYIFFNIIVNLKKDFFNEYKKQAIDQLRIIKWVISTFVLLLLVLPFPISVPILAYIFYRNNKK